VDAIDRAREACASAGLSTTNQFASAGKMITAGKGAERIVEEYFLTRYACYLIAMNADPSKAEVGFAQTYFAVQARRQEINDELSADDKRIEGRKRVREGNTRLSRAAYGAGVRRMGIFHDAGVKALYGGFGVEELRALRQLKPKENVLDRMGRTELAANEFRITQAEQKLVNDNVQGEAPAIRVHEGVGREVREAIKKIGGTMPERLPVEPPIKELEAKLRRAIKARPELANPD
jgi:DNA-damage-inducible protein D